MRPRFRCRRDEFIVHRQYCQHHRGNTQRHFALPGRHRSQDGAIATSSRPDGHTRDCNTRASRPAARAGCDWPKRKAPHSHRASGKVGTTMVLLLAVTSQQQRASSNFLSSTAQAISFPVSTVVSIIFTCAGHQSTSVWRSRPSTCWMTPNCGSMGWSSKAVDRLATVCVVSECSLRATAHQRPHWGARHATAHGRGR
jgi:hypothetical protein